MSQQSVLLIIEGTYPWYRGGVSEWVHQYIRNLGEIDFQILQVATDQYLKSDINQALYKLPDHITSFKRIPPPDLTKPWVEESDTWFENLDIDWSTLLERVSIVHIANTGFAGWLGMKLADLYRKPLVLTEHAIYWKEVAMGAVALECGYHIPEFESEKKSMTGMFKSLASNIYKNCDDIISVSRTNIPHQQALGAKSVRYIPNGVEKVWFEKKDNTGEKLTIGWIGRCAEMKNPLKFFDLIDAFDECGISTVNFILMSCDANEPKLQLALEDKLMDYPHVEFIWNKASERYLSVMDALCITSHNESQPLVLFEAISKGVLPIGWEAGDVTDNFGLILPGDVPARQLVQQVKSLWSERAKWNKKVDGLQKKIKHSHTWDHIFDEYRLVFSPYLKD